MNALNETKQNKRGSWKFIGRKKNLSRRQQRGRQDSVFAKSAVRFARVLDGALYDCPAREWTSSHHAHPRSHRGRSEKTNDPSLALVTSPKNTTGVFSRAIFSLLCSILLRISSFSSPSSRTLAPKMKGWSLCTEARWLPRNNVARRLHGERCISSVKSLDGQKGNGADTEEMKECAVFALGVFYKNEGNRESKIEGNEKKQSKIALL